MTDLTRSSTLQPAPLRCRADQPSESHHDGNRSQAGGGTQPHRRRRVPRAVVRSDALLQGHSHVSIVHNGETYQLRATRLGKLILTK